jgi:hypothetical protein
MSSTTDARVSPNRAQGSGGEVSSPVLSPPLPPRAWVKLYTQTASARARIAAARTITVPAEEAAMMARDYPRLGLPELARRYGYCTKVIRRTLTLAGVAIRKRGRPFK